VSRPITPLERMAGTTRLELATSAVTVLQLKRCRTILSDSNRQGCAVFMHLGRTPAILSLILTDTARHLLRLAGMPGLRHK